MKAQEILDMIEAVDPDDTGKLDEIDARVWCWRNNKPFCHIGTDKTFGKMMYYIDNDGRSIGRGFHPVTRSRDALKEIRPEGWAAFSMDFYGAFTDIKFWKCELGKPGKTLASVGLPTEELAELHAIIQAIEDQRS